MAGSQLQNLSSTVSGISVATKKTAGNLDAFDREFTKHVEAVKRTIGGSAQRKDREVMEALENARKALKNATHALGTASTVCAQYASSLA